MLEGQGHSRIERPVAIHAHATARHDHLISGIAVGQREVGPAEKHASVVPRLSLMVLVGVRGEGQAVLCEHGDNNLHHLGVLRKAELLPSRFILELAGCLYLGQGGGHTENLAMQLRPGINLS